MERILIMPPEGHRYRIDDLDGTSQQEIQFVQRGPRHEPKAGILIQDLLRICIHRVQVLNNEVEAPENKLVLHHLRQALVCQESRALRRKGELGKIKFPELLETGPDGHFKLAGD